MTDQIDITISSTFRDTGVKAAEAAFAKLTAAQDKAAAAAKRAMASPGDAKLAAAAAKAASAAQKAEAAYLKTAQSAARLASASGNAAGSVDVLSTALTRVDRSSTQALNAQVQLQRALNATERSAREAAGGAAVLPRTLESFGSGAVQQLQSVAAGFLSIDAALRAADFVKSTVDLANSTAQADAALRALAGSPTLYADALAAARQQQVLFGGSLQDNISGIQGLITVSRDSGLELSKLIDLSQRLAVKDPAQGAAGARIALQEAFSGDPTSLAKRYEIPKAALAALRDESTTSAEKLAILDQYLNNIGITSEVASGSVTKSAQQINMLAASAERAQIALGTMIAPGVGDAAEDLATGIDRLMQGTDGLRAAWEQLVLGAAATTAAENARIAALQAGATSAEAAEAATWAYRDAIAASTGAFGEGASVSGTWGDAQVQAAAASEAAAVAIGAMLTKTLEDKAAKEEADAQARQFAEAQQIIANLGGAVAAGLTTSAEGALILADRYGIAYSQALLLIDAQARIAGGAARIASQKANTRDLVPGGPGVNAPGRRGQSDEDILATVKRTTDEITAVGVRAQPVRTAAVKAGGGARASAEQSAADKIKQIAEDAAAKLVAIDERAAEQRARAQASLAASINATSADMVASQEANDLELVGASEDRLAELAAREQAEAQARIASIEAVKEARAIADAGDAEQAQAVLDERQKQIAAQQSLDEEYAKRRAELAGDPAATEALKTQYDEATAALAEATQVRIDLAAQEAAQRAEALAAEKQAVLDNASAQAAALGTTGSAADSARAQVNALIDAINAIPPAKTVTITVEEKGGSGGTASSGSGGAGGSSAKAAGGGTFVTSGPTNFTVGDNPGGVELVSVTPISGVGSSSISGSNVRMAGGGSAVVGDASDDAIRRLEEANKRAVQVGGGAAKAVSRGGGGGGGGGGGSSDPGDTLAAIDKAISVLDKIADLRDKLAEVGPPLDLALVNTLADEALAAAQIMGGRWAAITEDQEKAFARFAGTVENALSVLGAAADLRGDLEQIGPPIDTGVIAGLADEAARALSQVRQFLIPLSERQAEGIERFASTSGAAIGLLADASKLNARAFADYAPPTQAQIAQFASDAERVTRAIADAAATYDTEGLAAAQQFAEATGTVFETVKGGLETFDRLRFSDLGVDPAQLAAFTESTLAVLDTTEALAARAARIAPGDYAALGNATAAINAQAEALINLAAVPYGNLGGLAGGLGGGGGGSSITFSPGAIVVHGAPGMDVAALANLVAQQIRTQIGSRR